MSDQEALAFKRFMYRLLLVVGAYIGFWLPWWMLPLLVVLLAATTLYDLFQLERGRREEPR